MKEQSLKWWSLLSPELKNHYCVKHKGTNNRCETLTAQEIYDTYQSEIVGVKHNNIMTKQTKRKVVYQENYNKGSILNKIEMKRLIDETLNNRTNGKTNF